MRTPFKAHVMKTSVIVLYLALLLVSLSSCSFFGAGAPTIQAAPPVWTSYQSTLFTMKYFSNWDVATKDFYLGTHYPQLEMLQGTLFTKQGASTTFLQVAYATKINKAASAKDIMLKFLLASSTQPAAASSLSTTMLSGETWYQGSIEKQITQSDGPKLEMQETALGVDRTTSSGSTEIYLIFYQDTTRTFDQNTHDFFERMIQSFQFGVK
jgi:hypothetical protein